MPAEADNELFYLLCLSRVEGVGGKTARKWIEFFGNAESVFKAASGHLEKSVDAQNPEAAAKAVAAVKKFRDFATVEKEIRFLEKNKVQALRQEDDAYPQMLLHCDDRPLLLFYLGNADLNHPRMISVVGTRKYSEYGRHLTEQLCQGLAGSGCQVVSGLAYGIDAIAHRAALASSLETVGVLGHGLGMIYPPRNASLAASMCSQGGLLTEYFSGAPALRHQFPQRNRIVAGISVATVVIESPRKGGSLITADLADNYNRDVFAFPGRTTDESMAGNNHLIRKNKAAIITCAEDLLEMLGWQPEPEKIPVQAQPREPVNFFEQPVLDLISQNEAMSFEQIQAGMELSDGAIAEALLYLEIKRWIRVLPGKRYVAIR